MRRWGLVVCLFCLIAAYWGYAVDIECHVNGYLTCVSEHDEAPLGCAAPAVQASAPTPIVCAEMPQAYVLPAAPELPPPCLPVVHEWRVWKPPEPDVVDPGPPRAPPFVLS